MKRLTAIITFTCFLSVSTAEGRVLTVFVKTGCSVKLVPVVRAPKSACGSCTSFNYCCEVYKCVPYSRAVVSFKNMIDYKQANSITDRGSNELSNPVFSAILGDSRGLSTERPPAKISEAAVKYNEGIHYSPVFENLAFIHPKISITVLRL